MLTFPYQYSVPYCESVMTLYEPALRTNLVWYEETTLYKFQYRKNGMYYYYEYLIMLHSTVKGCFLGFETVKI